MILLKHKHFRKERTESTKLTLEILCCIWKCLQ